MKKLLFAILAIAGFSIPVHAVLTGPAVLITTGTLQPGTTNGCYISSGTIINFNSSTAKISSMTILGTQNILGNLDVGGYVRSSSSTVNGNENVTGTAQSTTVLTSSSTVLNNENVNGNLTVNQRVVASSLTITQNTSLSSTTITGQLIGFSTNTFKGTVSGAVAPAGYWNEVISTSIARTPGLAVGSNATPSVATMTITAGNWLISAACGFNTSAASTGQTACVSKTPNACPSITSSGAVPVSGEIQMRVSSPNAAGDDMMITTPTFPYYATSPSAFYLVCQVSFGSGSGKVYGSIMAVRQPQ